MATYKIDLSKITLAQFETRLREGSVLPGRVILKEDLAARFKTLADCGIANLEDLTNILKTKKKLADFAQTSGLSEEYLTILRREANSFVPGAVALEKFPEVDPAVVAKLQAVGIKHSYHLIERTQTEAERTALAAETGLAWEDLRALCQMTDLARVSGVGPVFARMLWEAGIQSAAQLAAANADTLYEELCALNEAKGYTNAGFTVKDVVYCMDTAGLLPVLGFGG